MRALVGLLTVLFFLCSAAAMASTTYVLQDFSLTEEGCFAPCMCPLFGLFLGGTFELTPTGPDGDFQVLAIDDVDWVATVGGPVVRVVTGSGTFRVGDEQQQLVLDLQFDGGAVKHYDSGLVPVVAEFPEIDVLASVGDLFCYDEVVDIRAAPLDLGYLDLAVDPYSLYWSVSPDAAAYEVVMGDLAYLRSSGGDFTGATDACLGDAVELPILDHGSASAGRSVWFLVRGLPGAPYDSNGTGQQDPGDAEIESAPLACP